jgi:hypothetical protein
MNHKTCLFVSAMALATVAHADVYHNYENLSEGFLGATFSADGITYRDVNNVSGIQPDGEAFEPGDLGDQLIIEDATLFFNDFADYGSADKVLTFGSAYINGDNLSIGALASVWMDLDELGEAASFDIAFYENGPWGNIEYHLDALLAGQVVSTDSYTLANGGGRDNVNWINMAVSGAQFDQLHLYATLDGHYVAPRGMIDNLSVISAAPVPEPATMAALGMGALALLRRKRRA